MSKNVLSKINTYGVGNHYYPLFELLRNDCTLSIDIVTNTQVAISAQHPETLVAGYDSWSDKKSVAKITVIIRGANDYSSNMVDKVYYSDPENGHDKLTLDDFTLYSDAISDHLFGLKQYNGRIYFCSHITEHKASYTVNVLSYDNPPCTEPGIASCAYRQCNYIDDYDVFSQYFLTVDKGVEYTQFDRGCVHRVLLPSDCVLKVTVKTTSLNRFTITAKGTGYLKTIDDILSVMQGTEKLFFRYYTSSSDGKLYIESEELEDHNPFTFYLVYDSMHYKNTLVEIFGGNVAMISTDVIPVSEFTIEGKTEITERANYGTNPEWYERSIGSSYFRTYPGKFPNTPIWWNGGNWVFATGFTATTKQGWGAGNRPVGSHTEGDTTVGALNPYLDLGFEFFDTKLNKTLRAVAIND